MTEASGSTELTLANHTSLLAHMHPYVSSLPDTCRLTKAYLRQLCKEMKQYTTPELNDVLYLHYKGTRRLDDTKALLPLTIILETRL
jgi:hypothetical protein